MVKLKANEKIAAQAEKENKEAQVKAPAKKAVKTEAKEEAIKTNATLEDLAVVLHPLVSEKAVNMIEAENKITFIVAHEADKKSVRRVVESAYGVKVDKVNIIRDMKGRKKAIVKLKKEFKAQDLATKLKIL